ncbi:putative methyl-accepting chemotaxis sensory transducer [Magnetofaba australis IT-1]|uniref:Putative methyl-accepting chemotaxis sensory transducer n=2 Tax=Magnetofaba TaxID=1472292 RepID=A0A1Y2K171_9PROT|nr:putative methyl-accepting chemotaxis sensory transducer [Magnetofaba australis IT-1]
MLIIGVAVYFISSSALYNVIEVLVDQRVNSKLHDVDMNIERISHKALVASALVAALPQVRDAYATVAAGDEEGARKQLAAFMKSIKTDVEKVTGIKKFRVHFHLPPAKSFLRIWNGTGGDDLSSFRDTVLRINRDGKPLLGIEIGRGGFVLRGLSPVFDAAGKQVGSVETLMPMAQVVNKSKTREEEEFAVLMHKSQLNVAKRFAKTTPKSIGEFLLTSATKGMPVEDIAPDSLKESMRGDLNFPFDDHHLTYHPIKDFSGKVVGVLVYRVDLNVVSSIRSSLVWKLGGPILLLMLVSMVIYWLVTKRVVGRIKSIADGIGGITGGNLTERLEIPARSDELDDISRGFNAMVDSLADILRGVSLQTDSVSAAVRQLNEVRGVLSEDAGGIRQQARDTMESVKRQSEGISRMESAAQSASSSMQQINEQANALANAMGDVAHEAADVSGNVNTVAAATEQMSANVASVRQNLEQISGSITQVDSAVGSMGQSLSEIDQQTQSAREESRQADELTKSAQNAIKELASATQEIDKVVDDQRHR